MLDRDTLRLAAWAVGDCQQGCDLRSHARPLLDKLPGVPKWVVAIRGYNSHAFREHAWSLDAQPVIPTRRNEETLAWLSWIYTNRNRVERLWARLKEWRGRHAI